MTMQNPQFFHQAIPDQAPKSTCHLDNCEEEFFTDNSHRFGVGLSHYRLESDGSYTRSYNQVFKTFHCCNRSHALQVAHNNVDTLRSLPFGKYNASAHNPDLEQTHEVAQANVEYNKLGMLPASALPKVCAICGTDLKEDVYVPHVDDSTNGHCYQDYMNGITFGACSLDHGLELAHKLLDDVVEAYVKGKPLPALVQPTGGLS